jgi:hypothetical protein
LCVFFLGPTSLTQLQASQYTSEELDAFGIDKRKFCKSCARFGYFELAQWGQSQNCCVLDIVSATVSSKAPESRVLPFLKWARSKGAKFFHGECKEAARGGYLETVKWMVQEGQWVPGTDRWRQEVVVGAAIEGHMDILQWAKDQGFLDLRFSMEYDMGLLKSGIIGGTEILKWLLSENSIPVPEISGNSNPLFYCGLHALEMKRLSEKGEVPEEDQKKILEMVKCLRDLGAQWSVLTCQMFAESGFLEVVRWIRNNGCPWDESMCAYAARSGSFEILKWVREQGCPWDKYTCSYAALCENLEILKWARENGCPWDSNTSATAAMGGNFEILKWVLDHGCPWDYQIINFAARSNNLEMFQWAHEHGPNPWTETTCAAAAQRGSLEILQWAREHGFPWDESTCIKAIDGNHLETLNWAFTNGCPCPPKKIFRAAITIGNLDALNWAKKNVPLDANTARNFLINRPINITHSHVFAWLQKNGMLFPEDFPTIANTSNSLYLAVWMVKETLPPEFREKKWEIETVVDRFGQSMWMDLAGQANKVLRGLMKPDDFCEMIFQKWGGR